MQKNLPVGRRLAAPIGAILLLAAFGWCSPGRRLNGFSKSRPRYRRGGSSYGSG